MPQLGVVGILFAVKSDQKRCETLFRRCPVDAGSGVFAGGKAPVEPPVEWFHFETGVVYEAVTRSSILGKDLPGLVRFPESYQILDVLETFPRFGLECLQFLPCKSRAAFAIFGNK